MNNILVLIFIVLPIVGYLFYKLAPSSMWSASRGERGERRTSSMLSRLPDFYHVMDNVMIQQRGGGSTQIDHVVVSRYGIFVIETKNYTGKIYGSEGSEYWTEYFTWYSRSRFRRGLHSESYRFYNPMRQNMGHIRALRSILYKYGTIPYYSVIVFSNDAEFKIMLEQGIVTNWENLNRAIMRVSNVVMDDEQVQAIIRTIEAARFEGTKEEVRSHVESVKATQATKNAKISSGVCPHCGGTIVLREGPYGRFYGCSNYPRCKFKMN